MLNVKTHDMKTVKVESKLYFRALSANFSKIADGEKLNDQIRKIGDYYAKRMNMVFTGYQTGTINDDVVKNKFHVKFSFTEITKN